jgi:hypothetical protein
MLEIGRLASNNVRIFDTQYNNGVIINRLNINQAIEALTRIKESIEKDEAEKIAKERKINRAMERLEQIASVLNYKIVDSKEHFILIDLDELKESQVLPLSEIIEKFVNIYVRKLTILNVLSTYDEILGNKKICKVIEELKEIEKILVK